MEDPKATGALRGLEAEFEVIRELGRGGSAVVYLAIERELGREVAIKTIHPVFAADPDATARLVREARTLARLQHPNIVTFYGVRRLAAGGLAVVMQYVRGERLKDRIRAVGPLAVQETRDILGDIGRALVHAHRHHVVHRDIKPENIYLDSDLGLARLSDFGIARPWDQDGSLTQAGLAIGTPAYMAPEQIDGGILDARSDIYSLGLVAHEMLSGQRPWEGQNLYGIIYKQKNEALPSIASFRSDVPADLLGAIEKALAKQPDDRWATAEAFLSAIHAPPRSPAAMPVVVPPPRMPDSPVADLPAGAEDDAPTIPYRPADVLSAPKTAGDAAPGLVGLGSAAIEEEEDESEDELVPAAAPAERVATAAIAGEAGALADAERAFAEWDAAVPASSFRFARRHMAVAGAMVVGIAGGLAAISLIRSHNARPEKVANAWVSRPTTVAMRPVATFTDRPAPAVPPAVDSVAAPAAAPVVDSVTRPTVTRTASSPSRENPRPERARPARVVLPPPPPPPVRQTDADAASAQDEQPVAPRAPTLIGTPVAPAPRRAASADPTAPAPKASPTAPPAQLRDLEAAPVFTPFTVAPELRNGSEISAALRSEYPRLRTAGTPSGRVIVWLLLDDNGTVRKTQLKESSGTGALDEVALRLGRRMRFSPALDRDRRVPAWVSVPVDFVTR